MKDKIIKEFIEKGANLEHQRWARWQKYLHSLCKRNKDGSLIISKERVKYWEKEIATPYSKLTEELKEYDRKETRNYLPLLEQAISQARADKRERILEKIKLDDWTKKRPDLKPKGMFLKGFEMGYSDAVDDLDNLKTKL